MRFSNVLCTKQVATNGRDGGGISDSFFSDWKIRPALIAARDLIPDNLSALIENCGLVIVRGVDEPVVDGIVALAGLRSMMQYELVQSNQTDPFVLRTVAKSGDSGITPASKPKSTLVHQDGYQFPARYCGFVIAGNLHMPDVEILHYPVVREKRLIFVHGVPAAVKATARIGADLIGALKQPLFSVDIDEYKRLDPLLNEPEPFPVIYADELGWRCQIGGRVYSNNADAQFAIDVFRRYLESEDVYSFQVEPGDLAFFNQRLVAHAGLRPTRDGETVLVRRLMRWQR